MLLYSWYLSFYQDFLLFCGCCSVVLLLMSSFAIEEKWCSPKAIQLNSQNGLSQEQDILSRCRTFFLPLESFSSLLFQSKLFSSKLRMLAIFTLKIFKYVWHANFERFLEGHQAYKYFYYSRRSYNYTYVYIHIYKDT